VVFLLVITVPALEWLLAHDEPKQSASRISEESHTREPDRATVVSLGLSRPIRLSFLAILLVATVVQAIDFQVTFRKEGPKREYEFDVPYKVLYDAAVGRPERPIYLENGMWGPAYMGCVFGTPLWKADLYLSFVRLPDRSEAPTRRDRHQLKLRLSELRSYPEKRRLSALSSGEVDGARCSPG